jgi:hypothetical protein
LADLGKKALNNPIGKLLDMKAGSQLLACVGVNDVTPAHNEPTGVQKCYNVGGRILMSLPDNYDSPASLSRASFFIPPASVAGTDALMAIEHCSPIMRNVGTRLGPQDRLAQDIVLADKEFVSDRGEHSGLMLLELKLGDERREIAGKQSIPSNKSCSIVTADISDGGARLTSMHADKTWVSAQKNYADLAALVELINIDRTRYAFGLSAVIATETAKQNVEEVIRGYRR